MASPVIDRSTVEQIVRQVALEYLHKTSNGKAPLLTVQTSSRHMHICREDMDVLSAPVPNLPSIAHSSRKATSPPRKR